MLINVYPNIMGHNKITWKELDKLNDARHLSF